MSSGIEHTHDCPTCHQPYPCRLDCDDVEDGAGVCGPCAEAAFDAIAPQETFAYKNHHLSAMLYEQALDDRCFLHRVSKCPECNRPAAPPPSVPWRSVPRDIFNALRLRLANWIGGPLLHDDCPEDYDE